MEIEKLTPAEASLPLVRNYTSCRAYIRDWFEFKKKHRSGFSYRRFSAVLGLKSPNFMQLVLAGERNISDDLAIKLCEQLGLKGSQKNYFLAMVQYEQAKSSEEREKFEKILLAEKRKMVTSHVDKMKTEILSRWYHMLVRELVFLPNFEPSGEFISSALNGLISVQEAETSFRMLLESGFIERASDGKYVPKDAALDTGDFVFQRDLVREAHSQTLVAWGKNLKELNSNEQELGLLHIPIASEKIPELRERIRKFQDEIIGWLCEEKNPDRVVQLGTYLVPFDKMKD